MTRNLVKSWSAAGVALAVVVGSAGQPVSAFAGCHRHHHRVVAYYSLPKRFARVSSYWQPQGYGCGPFADDADGWDVGWTGRCYYPDGF